MSSLVAFLQDWEGQFVEELACRRTQFLTRLMKAATWLGDGWAWLLLAMCSFCLEGRSSLHFLVPAAIALMLDVPIYSVLKHLFSRPRPFHCRQIHCAVNPPDRFSFPSGHTSVAFAMLVVASAC